jgi:formate/nitrite transporter FocA (FNT family)
MKESFKLAWSGILAGVWISFGCILNLILGGVLGAFMFCIGLTAVVSFSYKLYTGTAGFISTNKFTDYCRLLFILLFNIVGCALTALCVHYSTLEVIEPANAIVIKRLSMQWWQILLQSIACGMMMTFAVKFAREGKWLPLILAVPAFILSGYLHSIADGFYYCVSQVKSSRIILVWCITVLGNFIGCNAHRFIRIQNEK